MICGVKAEDEKARLATIEAAAILRTLQIWSIPHEC